MSATGPKFFILEDQLAWEIEHRQNTPSQICHARENPKYCTAGLALQTDVPLAGQFCQEKPCKEHPMSEIDTLLRRIDAEFKSVEERVHQFQEQKVAEYKGRQDRLEQFSQVCEKLQSVWRPRLEALAQRFGDKVKMQPEVKPTLREATFHFQSQLARIDLKFSATTDSDVRKLVLRYDLAILPILMKFEPHAVLEMPLDQVDPAAVAKWTDDRIIDFVKTYVSLHENQYYLKDYLVEDPIAGVRFPKYAAAAKLDFKGKTHYFISEETRSEFASREGLGADG